MIPSQSIKEIIKAAIKDELFLNGERLDVIALTDRCGDVFEQFADFWADQDEPLHGDQMRAISMALKQVSKGIDAARKGYGL